MRQPGLPRHRRISFLVFRKENFVHKAWKPSLVEVEWDDACTIDSLHGTLNGVLDEAKLVRRLTVGYLLKSDDRVVVLAKDYDPPESNDDVPEVGNITVIPAGWVVRIVSRERKKYPRRKEVTVTALPE